MTLRDDVRKHFARDEGRLPTPAGLRESVTSEASRAEATERRPVQWATAVALLLAVAIVAGLLAANGLRQARVTPVVPAPTPTPTMTKNLGHGTILEADLYFVSTGWALLEACNAATCQYSVSMTKDGGASWSAPSKVGPDFAASNGDAPRHIHFATQNDGFVFGNAVGFATHDGGRTWAGIGFQVSEVVAIVGTGPVWAVTRPCAKGTQCAYEVHVGSNGGRTWSQAAALPDGFVPRNAVAFPYGMLLSGFGAGDMLITRDTGVTWTAIPGRCSADTFANYIATPDAKELWQVCDTAMLSLPPPMSVFVSEDGGTSWSQKPMVPSPGMPVSLESPAPGTALLASPSRALRTQNRGQTWKPVTNGGFWSVGFGSTVGLDCGPLAYCWPQDGWAVDSQRAILVTHDRGLTWAPVPVQP
jgi:photosystem II stability/assembly factor-like uncharacterized protein